MRKFSTAIRNLNHTLHLELNRYALEKDADMSSEHSKDYGGLEDEKLTSSLQMYAKKNTVELIRAEIEQLKSEMKALLEERNQFDVIGNNNMYDKKYNETLQEVKQVGWI